jgi:IS30 family transposase
MSSTNSKINFRYVALRLKWSPEQISAKLVVAHAGDAEMRVSHETIYQSLYLQARGVLRTELTLALRQGRAKRVSRSRVSCSKGKIRGMVNVSERPAEAADRAVPGFWEGDLIIGKANASQIATLVERTTRFTMLVRIPYDRNAERVAKLLAMKMETLPELMRKSVTWDQGKEMARHADFSVSTGIDVYFCDPHSPWHVPRPAPPSTRCGPVPTRRSRSTANPGPSAPGSSRGRGHGRTSAARCSVRPGAATG